MQDKTNCSRRHFLVQISALGVAGLVGGTTFEPAPHGPNEGSLDQLTAADFQKHIGETFRIGDSMHAELLHVRRLKSSRPSASRTRAPFSLQFRLASAERLPHRTYALEHTQMGRYEVFLGAVGDSGAEVRLEAIFA